VIVITDVEGNELDNTAITDLDITSTMILILLQPMVRFYWHILELSKQATVRRPLLLIMVRLRWPMFLK